MSNRDFRVDFIDPLFAVAVHIGFTHGIIEEQCLKNWNWPKGEELFDLGVFGLGFLTLLLSWEGYHASIIEKPLKGFWRFILDVLLVMLYVLILVKFKDFSAALSLLALTYLLFLVWDSFKIKEYPEKYKPSEDRKGWLQRYRREVVTFVWFVVFTVLWLSYRYECLSSVLVLPLAYLSTILYRVNKKWRILGGYL